MNKRIAKIIIFGLVGILTIKLCFDFGCYVYDNIQRIRAEKEYAEYKQQQEQQYLYEKVSEMEMHIKRQDNRCSGRYWY